MEKSESMSSVMDQGLLAKALFDNIAETVDELAFRKGDVLRVIEKDTGGLEGWWLCSLRGKQGIVPGNRLKLVSGIRESLSPHSIGHYSDTSLNQSLSPNTSANKVVMPNRSGDVYLYNQGSVLTSDYDVPPSRSNNSSIHQSFNQSINDQPSYDTPQKLRNESGFNTPDFNQSLYDTPPQNKPYTPEDTYDVPPSASSQAAGGEVYDVPSSASNRSSILSNLSHLSNESTMTYSSSSFSSKSRGKSNSNPPSMCDSARSSMDISAHDFYDVPPSAVEVRTLNHNKQPSADSGLDLYDSPPKGNVKPMCEEREIMHDYDDIQTDYDTPKPATDTSLTPKLDNDVNSRTPNISNIPKHESHKNTPIVPVSETKKGGHTITPNVSLGDFNCSVTAHTTVGSFPDPYDMVDGVEHDIDDVYDVPQSNAPVQNKLQLRTKLEEKFSKNAGSILCDINEKSKQDPSGVYDIPPQVTRDSIFSSKSDSSDGTEDKRLSTCSIDSRNSDIPTYAELPLDLDAAMDLMIKLQQDVQRTTTKMSSFVSSVWRLKSNLEPNLYSIKIACHDVKSSLEEFLDFSQGTLANSARLPDRKLINKLHKQLCPLQQTLFMIKVCMKNLEDIDWQVSRLETSEGMKNDDLGKIAMAAKDLTPDVKRLVSLIHGNSSLLFKRASEVPINEKPSEYKTVQESNLYNINKPPLRPKPNLPPKPHAGTGNGNKNSMQLRPLPAPPVKERPLPPTPTDKEKRFSGDFKNWDDFKRYSAEFKRLSLEMKDQTKSDCPAHDKKVSKNIVDEYDYVHLEARDIELQKNNKDKRLSNEMDDTPVRDSDQSCVSSDSDSNTLKRNADKSSHMEVKTPGNSRPDQLESPLEECIKLDPSDKQVLNYYTGQLNTHSTLLTNAIDAFFACIECGQGPKDFISHSKFVVVSAHKLIYVSDSLSKNLMNEEIKNRVMHCANHLCNCLKLTVTTTKTAALQYPSVPAVQDMVDRVADVSHITHELKLVISHAASL